mmetsp:Transcript_51676/g.102047  ORF Transcript_51676/g.102047 Transcript_51676/m.102047 type:complete len:223 (-) Transcript_51676:891-1559(-)
MEGDIGFYTISGDSNIVLNVEVYCTCWGACPPNVACLQRLAPTTPWHSPALNACCWMGCQTRNEAEATSPIRQPPAAGDVLNANTLHGLERLRKGVFPGLPSMRHAVMKIEFQAFRNSACGAHVLDNDPILRNRFAHSGAVLRGTRWGAWLTLHLYLARRAEAMTPARMASATVVHLVTMHDVQPGTQLCDCTCFFPISSEEDPPSLQHAGAPSVMVQVESS